MGFSLTRLYRGNHKVDIALRTGMAAGVTNRNQEAAKHERPQTG